MRSRLEKYAATLRAVSASEVDDGAGAVEGVVSGALAVLVCEGALAGVVCCDGLRLVARGALGVVRGAGGSSLPTPVSPGAAGAAGGGGVMVAAVVRGAVVLPNKNALVEIATSSTTPPPTTNHRGTSTVLLISTSELGRREPAVTPDLPVGAGRLHGNARRIAQCFSFEWSDGWLDVVDRTAVFCFLGVWHW